jgi:hypothetical protein
VEVHVVCHLAICIRQNTAHCIDSLRIKLFGTAPITMKSFYINLDHRTDRRLEFESECVRMGLESERFPAVKHSIPALGCTLSHLSALKTARDRGYERVCIFEDDFEFVVSKDEYETLLTSIPADFDVVMLGWYIIESAPYDATFGRVIAATTASGYIVNQRFYDTLIRNIEEAVVGFRESCHTYDVISKYSNDQYWRRIQPAAMWLYSLKRIGKQRPSFSDLVGCKVAYDY